MCRSASGRLQTHAWIMLHRQWFGKEMCDCIAYLHWVMLLKNHATRTLVSHISMPNECRCRQRAVFSFFFLHHRPFWWLHACSCCCWLVINVNTCVRRGWRYHARVERGACKLRHAAPPRDKRPRPIIRIYFSNSNTVPSNEASNIRFFWVSPSVT